MRSKLQYLFLISTLLFLLLSTTNAMAAINWQPFNGAFAKAKAQHKLVLIYGKSESCHWCNRMNSESFSDSQIVSVINKKYIPVKVDVVNNSSLADSYNIYGTPTI